MASCDSQTLKANAACLGACMTEIELLAAIACLLATQNGMACDAATLKSQAACIWPCMSPDELLASIAYTLCNGGGGGGGGGSFTVGTGNPEGAVTGSPGDRFWDDVNDFQYTKVTGASTNTGWKNS